MRVSMVKGPLAISNSALLASLFTSVVVTDAIAGAG
jgi:hypothetical protein